MSRIRKITVRWKVWSCIAAGTLLLSPAVPSVQAGSLSSSVLASLPKNVSKVGYADIAHAREFPWFAQFKSQLLPTQFGDFERFLASVGLDVGRQVDELAWALTASDFGSEPTLVANPQVPPAVEPAGRSATPAAKEHPTPEPDQLLGIALGNFDRETSEALLEKLKVPQTEWRGRVIYGCGGMCHDSYLVFLDSNTIAFGKIDLLQRMLEARSGVEENIFANELLLPLVTKVNGPAIFWGVFDQAGAREAMQQLVPEAGNFPEAAKLISNIKALTVTITGDDELNGALEVYASPEDAVVLGQLLQAGLLFRQFHASQNDPQFAKILQEVTVVPGGSGILVRFGLTSEQMVNLIQSNTFSRKM